ncbi:MAG: hypothetical protein Q9169_007898, partial [Polycauliona sp. 2 TL-2023]
SSSTHMRTPANKAQNFGVRKHSQALSRQDHEISILKSSQPAFKRPRTTVGGIRRQERPPPGTSQALSSHPRLSAPLRTILSTAQDTPPPRVPAQGLTMQPLPHMANMGQQIATNSPTSLVRDEEGIRAVMPSAEARRQSIKAFYIGAARTCPARLVSSQRQSHKGLETLDHDWEVNSATMRDLSQTMPELSHALVSLSHLNRLFPIKHLGTYILGSILLHYLSPTRATRHKSTMKKPRIPGSALGKFSLVDEEGFVAGTSTHALTSVNRRLQMAAEAVATVNPADLSFVNKKRKDDAGDDEEETTGAHVSTRPGSRPGGHSKRARPETPGANGYNALTSPFGWFTVNGYSPLDANPDVVWMLEDGRYYAYRLSTSKRDVYVTPHLATSVNEALQSTANAKQELRRQKQRITGNPNTKWDDQLPTAPRSSDVPHISNAAAASMVNTAVANTAAQSLPGISPFQAMPTALNLPGRQSSAAPARQATRINDDASDHANITSVPTAMMLPYTTVNNGHGQVNNDNTSSGQIDGTDERGGDPIEVRARSVLTKAEAYAGEKALSESSKQAEATGAKAGSSELKPGKSKATKSINSPPAKYSQQVPKGTMRIKQRERVEEALANQDGVQLSRKPTPTNGVNVPKPKKIKSSKTTSASHGKAFGVLSQELPYNENHMFDRKVPNKRKSMEARDDNPKPQKVRVTGQTQKAQSTLGTSRYTVANTSSSTSNRSSENAIATYTPSDRFKAKSDPRLQLEIDQAEKHAKSLQPKKLLKVPKQSQSTSAITDDPNSHHSISPSSKPLSETEKETLAQLDRAMPFQEKVVELERHKMTSDYLAQQYTNISNAFGGKLSSKVQPKAQPSSKNSLPPMRTFRRPSIAVNKAQGSTREEEEDELQLGLMPTGTSSRNMEHTASCAVNSGKAAKQISGSQTAASFPSSTAMGTTQTISGQSGSKPAASAVRKHDDGASYQHPSTQDPHSSATTTRGNYPRISPDTVAGADDASSAFRQYQAWAQHCSQTGTGSHQIPEPLPPCASYQQPTHFDPSYQSSSSMLASSQSPPLLHAQQEPPASIAPTPCAPTPAAAALSSSAAFETFDYADFSWETMDEDLLARHTAS